MYLDLAAAPDEPGQHAARTNVIEINRFGPLIKALTGSQIAQSG
jgi:hypothetical protein